MTSTATIDDLIGTAAGARNAADLGMVEVMAKALEHDEWSERGFLRPEAFLQWAFGVNGPTAASAVRIARRIDELPNTVGALRDGWLSLDKAALIARHCPAEFEVSASQTAQHMTLPQIARTLREYLFDADEIEGPERQAPADGVRIRDIGFGKSRISITCDQDDARTLTAGIERTKAQLLNRDDLEDPTLETERAELEAGVGDPDRPDRRYPTSLEALLDIFHTANQADPSWTRRDAHRVVIHAELADLLQPDAAAFVGRYALGGYVTAAKMAETLCECSVEVILQNNGVPFALAANDRTPSAALRRQVLDRDDQCCQYPGCTRSRHLAVHHIRWWRNGGKTRTSNLVTLCQRHHTLLHQGVFEIQGNPDDPQGNDPICFLRNGVPMRLRAQPPPQHPTPARPEPSKPPNYRPEERGQRLVRREFVLPPNQPLGRWPAGIEPDGPHLN